MRLEERAHLCERLRADEFVDDATIAEQLHRRNAADMELLRQVLVLVGVDLDDLDLAGVFVGELFEHGASARQGPHHGAQKSTRTGWEEEALTTSAGKVAVVTADTDESWPGYWDARRPIQ